MIYLSLFFDNALISDHQFLSIVRRIRVSNLIYRIKELRRFNFIVFILILLVFSFYGFFIAFNLDGGIIPDEPAHFLFSKHYATTLGIPPDTIETAAKGWYIQHNPFLYHWISGRVINLVQIILPVANDWQLLVVLRLVSLLYSLGSLIFCFLLSREIIKDKWYQLLPPFLLSNTLMFVFLAGGANYDNLAVFFCMAGLYFWIKVFTRNDYLTNSLSWMILISLGTLVKYSILPLALFMFITWLVYSLKKRKTIFPLTLLSWQQYMMIGSLVGLICINFAIYGYNLIVYKWILPECKDLLTVELCDLSPYIGRFREFALNQKLTIDDSINLGYPNPIGYIVLIWLPKMCERIFGILGHKSYFPSYVIYFQLLFLWMGLLAARYWNQFPFVIISSLIISISYGLVLAFFNYDTELVYGFKNFALQGRYYFPVIGLVFALFGYTLDQVGNKPIRTITVILTVILFLAGGPIQFLWHYNDVFSTWFIH
jgi:hypothetical protein